MAAVTDPLTQGGPAATCALGAEADMSRCSGRRPECKRASVDPQAPFHDRLPAEMWAILARGDSRCGFLRIRRSGMLSPAAPGADVAWILTTIGCPARNSCRSRRCPRSHPRYRGIRHRHECNRLRDVLLTGETSDSGLPGRRSRTVIEGWPRLGRWPTGGRACQQTSDHGTLEGGSPGLGVDESD